jgi:ATP-dependent helicase Lhr and Lhr-like helicase
LATTDNALLKAAAIIDLHESGYVEPVAPTPKPYHILAQQLMALALQEKGVGRHTWFEWLEGVPAFTEMDSATIDTMVSWMLGNGVLAEDQGVLWIGRKGEEAYGRRHFLELLSVFTSPPFFTVLHGKEELGYIDERTLLGKTDDERTLILGGRTWTVSEVNWNRRHVFVRPADNAGKAWWPGSGTGASFEVCQAVRRVLAEDRAHPAWSRRAADRVEALRQEKPFSLAASGTVLVTENGVSRWWTFGGGRANQGLAHQLHLNTGSRVSSDDFGLQFNCDIGQATVAEAIQAVSVDCENSPIEEKAVQGLKFADAIPTHLAVEVLQSRFADPSAMRVICDSPMQIMTLHAGQKREFNVGGPR